MAASHESKKEERQMVQLRDFIFNNNFFKFNNLYFQQTIGLPIGCKCGPSIANLIFFFRL